MKSKSKSSGTSLLKALISKIDVMSKEVTGVKSQVALLGDQMSQIAKSVDKGSLKTENRRLTDEVASLSTELTIYKSEFD